MDIRTAGIDDLDAVSDIASIVDPPHDGGDFDRAYYRHLMQHGRVVVAEASEIVVGYAAVIDVDGSQHLSDLFLHQDVRGHDVGRQLLDAVWKDGTAPRQTFASLHPAALPLYVRSGMTPRWPLLYLHGASERLPASSLVVEPCDASVAAGHEAEWLGWDRRIEYGYWSRRPEAQIFGVREGTTTIAVGCAVNSRGVHSLARLAYGDASDACDVVAAAARWCGEDVMVAVPGENPTVPTLIESGWRYIEHDLYCAGEPDLIDPQRLLPHPGFM